MTNKFLIKYIIFILSVFILLILVKIVFNNNDNTTKVIEGGYVSSLIEYNDENTIIHFEYPLINNNKIDNIIKNNIYSYVKEFKSNNEKKTLNVKYNLYYFDDYLNVVFDINNSLDKIKYKNFLFNLKNNDIDYITNVFDEEELSNKIYNIIKYKYSNDIYNKIKKDTLNNFTYVLYDDEIDVYFNNVKNIDYVPYVKISRDKNNIIVENKKYSKHIIFTFDDGPSKYTDEILKTLEYNNSSATFFMLGNRMNNFKDELIKIDKSNSEVASHTYSHKNLTKLSSKEMQNEINRANTIYKNITGKSIKYIRPPYGSYNDTVLSTDNYFVLWSIDPKDWYYKDSNKVYNNVINNACDGCIVLMHDIHYETIDAVKMLIPELNEMGYDVLSLSNALKYTKTSLNKSNVIRKIK